MKDKIHSKLIEYGAAIGEESRIDLVNELFDLFGVSHRRELLIAFYKHLDANCGREKFEDKLGFIDEFISNL